MLVDLETAVDGIVFLLEEWLVYIIDSYLGWKLKCLNDGFVSYKHAAFHITRY